MSQASVTGRAPLRVAVIGSGPAGFYAVQALLQGTQTPLELDMFDRLPTPYGLVRYGVAPDHLKIKSVTAVYARLAADPRFRFYGNVEYGTDLTLAELTEHYDQVVFATGAQSDRRLGIPGEDLPGSHPATEFVAWYNGHPDYADLPFDLDCECAVVIGAGNVAIDVARILCRTAGELVRSDIAAHALERLAGSRVREVHLVGRRGPAQAKFTNPEVKELGELEDAAAITDPAEIELDPLSRKAVEADGDRATERRLSILGAWAGPPTPGKSRRLRVRFLLSPLEILGSAEGRVTGVRLARNELVQGPDGMLASRITAEEQVIPCGLVFRSVGYLGTSLPGLPFDAKRGVLPNDAGRLVDPARGARPMPGLYAAGWIKRGPSGVIGTNKPDALETVGSMQEDLLAGRRLPGGGSREGLERRLRERGVRFVSFAEWERLDRLEMARGVELDRPRVKFTRRGEMLDALDGSPAD